ncbi:MAG: precorrin-6Y C5,15-methyltransferase (decarboxylating) subunit CbiT [Peptococcaceae bacterium]|nr:precorrin-6Y C5,15-methyltransferase (decarboxylating) subunit CbiT [Peptococcaceae bacterium]
MNEMWKFSVPGIPDELFSRGTVPMTREEIRVITLSKARLGPGMTVWDVGSGTGSIAVEAALMTPGGKFWAVERSAGGCRLIRENSARFGAGSVQVVEGEAPEALVPLPRPNRVIIGGSGGRLGDILEVVEKRILPAGRVVVNAVTLETLAGALDFFGDRWQTEVVQVSVNRSVKMGSSRLMKAGNPVYVISAWERGEDLGG